MTSPLVSVLMTVYNREKFLAAAIESVLAQSFTDWELIIVDDRSKDSSLEIARRYAKDHRVRVILNEQNLGDYPNRNCAASFARGKYLKYVDADDMIYPHCLELMVQGMEAFPEAGLGISRPVLGVFAPVLLSSADAYRDHCFGSGMFSAGPLDTIIRRSALEAIGGFHTGRSTGDFHCWLTLARNAPVVAIAPGLVWYRTHADQESALLRSPDAEVSAEFAARYFRFGVEALEHPQCPLAKEERLIGRTRAIKSFARTILGALCRGRFGLARTLYRQSGQRLFSFLQASLTHTPAAPRVVLNPVSPSKPVALPAPQSPISASDFQPSTPRPLVSVLIPAYNAEAHLAEAIASVLEQRFTDWELIVVDDASTDRTAEIAQSYADGNRIRYFRNEHNLGKWPNHNRCAKLARGRYLKFLHADDLLYPLCLQAMLRYAASIAKDEVLVLSVPSPLPAGTRLNFGEALRHECFLSPILVHSPSAFLMGAEAFRTLGGFQPGFAFCERHLQIRAAQHGSVVIANKGLVFFRRLYRWGIEHEEKHPMGLCEGMTWFEPLLLDKTSPLTETEKQYVVFRLRYGVARRAWKLLRAGRVALLRDSLKAHGIRLKDLLCGLKAIPAEHAAIGEALVQSKTTAVVE